MNPWKLIQTPLDDDTTQLDVTFSAKDATNTYHSVLRDVAFANQCKPAPDKELYAEIVEKVGEEQAMRQICAGMFSLLIPWTLDALDFETIAEPEEIAIPLPEEGKPYTFCCAVMPKPYYELINYDPVVITVPEPYVDDEQVDQLIDSIADNAGDYVLLGPDDEIQKGDHISLAIATTCNGAPVSQLTADSRIYDVGESWIAPKFDEGLEGMKVGETRTIEYEVEGMSPQEGASEIFISEVTIKDIRRKIIPTIDDAWVKANVPEASTVADLRVRIKENAERQQKQQYLENISNYVAGALADRLRDRIPDKLHEYAQSRIVQEVTAQAQSQGMSLQQYLANQGMSEQDFSTMLMFQARNSLVQGLALDSYFRHFGMELTDEDIEYACSTMAGEQMKPEYIKEQYENSGHGYVLREAARRYKACNHAAATATVRFEQPDGSMQEVAPEAAAEEGAE